jgi:hypothetical protein
VIFLEMATMSLANAGAIAIRMLQDEEKRDFSVRRSPFAWQVKQDGKLASQAALNVCLSFFRVIAKKSRTVVYWQTGKPVVSGAHGERREKTTVE